jgi:hypothetical protein
MCCHLSLANQVANELPEGDIFVIGGKAFVKVSGIALW